MKAFVITYKGSQRWSRALSHVAENGFEDVPYWGFNGNMLGMDSSGYNVFTLRTGNPERIRRDQLGCLLSHWSLWRALNCTVEQDGHWHLIVEDDVEFVPGGLDRFNAAMKAVPEKADMLYLGSCFCSDKEKEQVNEWWWDVRWPMCTHAYMVRHGALPVLIGTQERASENIDQSIISQTLDAGALKSYVLLPRIAVQQGTPTLE